MKSNIMLRIAAVLLCLTLFSTQLLSGMLARYTTMGSGSDSARVAGFGRLTLEETPASYKIIPGAPISKDPKITMTESEVAVRIYVDIATSDTGWMGSGNTLSNLYFTVTMADGWTYQESNGNIHTFYYDLPAGESLTDASVFRDDQIAVSSQLPYETYYTMTAPELTISARAEQID